MVNSEDDPIHPILENSFLWDLVEFSYHRDAFDRSQSFIDLVLARDSVKRRLRFFAPQEVELTRGIPNASGLLILDVSARQMEGLGVRVTSFEPDWCVPTFWASHVVEVTEDSSGLTSHKR